jgi:hypothetical protein
VLPGDAPGLGLALVGADRGQQAGDEAAPVGAEVAIPGDGRQANTCGGGDVDEVLQVARSAVEPIGVIDHQGVEPAGAEVVHHPEVLWALLAGVGADVVVDVLVHDSPAVLGGELPAGLELASHAQLSAVTVAGDAGVDSGSL